MRVIHCNLSWQRPFKWPIANIYSLYFLDNGLMWLLLMQPQQNEGMQASLVILQRGRILLYYTLDVEIYILSVARFSSMDSFLIPCNRQLVQKRRLVP